MNDVQRLLIAEQYDNYLSLKIFSKDNPTEIAAITCQKAEFGNRKQIKIAKITIIAI